MAPIPSQTIPVNGPPAFGSGDHSSAAHLPENVGDPCGQTAALAILEDVPKGTIVVAGTAVAILLIGWLLTFFLLFLPRGNIG